MGGRCRCRQSFSVQRPWRRGLSESVEGPASSDRTYSYGGVSSTAEQFLAAGAFALGVGGDLIDAAAIAAGRLDQITDNAKKYTEIVQSFEKLIKAIFFQFQKWSDAHFLRGAKEPQQESGLGGRSMMEYRKLGRTDLQVSVLGFGTAPFGGAYGAFDPQRMQAGGGLRHRSRD